MLDDAYHGLVYEDVPRDSLFWKLLEARREQPNLLPIKVDGSTKEFRAHVRIDTPAEAEYYRNGGILHYVLRRLAR